MNMLGMNGMFNGFSGGINPVSELFCGTNSIFNTCGGGWNSSYMFNMPNFACNYAPTDSMIGWGIANTVLNIGGQVLNQVMADKKENSNASIEAQIEEITNSINKNLKDLGISSERDLDNVKPAQKFDDAITTAKTNLEKLVEPAALTDEEKKDSAKVTAYNKAITEYNRQKNELEAELIAAKQAKENETTRLNNLVNATKELIIKRNNLQAQINERVFDDADGRKRQRTDATALAKKFTTTDSKTTLAAGATVTKEDVRAAIAGFRTATTVAEKKEWKEKFSLLWNQLDYNDRSNDLRAASRIILES